MSRAASDSVDDAQTDACMSGEPLCAQPASAHDDAAANSAHRNARARAVCRQAVSPGWDMTRENFPIRGHETRHLWDTHRGPRNSREHIDLRRTALVCYISVRVNRGLSLRAIMALHAGAYENSAIWSNDPRRFRCSVYRCADRLAPGLREPEARFDGVTAAARCP